MDRRFDDRERSMRRDEWDEGRRMGSRGDRGTEQYDRNSGSFYDNGHRSRRDDSSGSFYDSSHRSYGGDQGRDAGYTGRRDDRHDRLGASRDQDRYDSRGDFRRGQHMISDTAGRERSDYRDDRRRDQRGDDYRSQGSRTWDDRRDDRRSGEYNTSIFDNRDPDYPNDNSRFGAQDYGRRDDRDRYRGDQERMSQGRGGDIGGRHDYDRSREHDRSRDHDRRRDDDRRDDDDRRRGGDDEYRYHGRDYGFSWSDGSNDATWRQMDRWGNEYSNNARSEGYGWNRGSTRDHNFLSSPDRER